MSVVGICNAALALVGASPITALDDASTNAELCDRLYPVCRDEVLEAREWTFAVERASLPADATAPAYQWAYRYQVPADALRIIDADDGTGYADFEWVREGSYILANQASPLSVRYVKLVEDPTLWSSNFTTALTYRLASALATPITENRTLQADLWALYQKARTEASRLDGSQGRSEHVRISALHQRRV